VVYRSVTWCTGVSRGVQECHVVYRSVWLCGHSAGAHLAAMMAISAKLRTWQLLKGVVLEFLQVCLILTTFAINSK
jgi:predicted acylesterase/phospholipase RssA